MQKDYRHLSREQFLDRESDRKLVHQPYLLALAHHRTASRPSQRIMRSTLEQAKVAFDWGALGSGPTCDYSLNAVKTRPAKVDDKLTTRLFGWSTRGFAASKDRSVAVCLLPGTELSFAKEVRKVRSWPWRSLVCYETAIFRKINQH
jgi:hypothetical protein